MTNKNYLHQIPALLICAVLLSCTSSCKEHVKAKAQLVENEPIPVSLLPVQKAVFDQPISTSGNFTTNEETYLGFKTGGVVSSVLVKEGEAIQKDQLLATLDLTEMNAMVKQAQLAVEKAQRDFDRALALSKDSVATTEQLQNAKTALDLAGEQLVAAKFNLRHSEIRAVSDGFILRKMANPGQIVGPGTPVFQTNSNKRAAWVLKAGVSDAQWAAIQLNDKAAITTDLNPGEAIQAIVSSKSEGADPLTGQFSIELKLVDEKALRLADGLFAKATVFPSQKVGYWSVPYVALLDGNDNKGYVFITKDQKTALRIPVSIARIEKDQVLIDGGLEGISTIIVSGSAYLSDSSKITIR